MANSDIEWEKWGRTNPYYGVSSHKHFLRENFSGENSEAFFNSGEEVADTVCANIARHFVDPRTLLSAADFGCGVGRLTIPFAKRCSNVVGIDVSESMLAEARRNSVKAGLTNISFVKSDDQLSRLNGPINLIVTFYVLQHIPVKRGLVLIRQLLSRLAPGGIGVMQFPINDFASRPRRVVNWAQVNVPLVHRVVNILKSRPIAWPQMQANVYPVNSVLALLAEQNCERMYLEIIRHERFPSVVVYCQKK